MLQDDLNLLFVSHLKTFDNSSSVRHVIGRLKVAW